MNSNNYPRDSINRVEYRCPGHRSIGGGGGSGTDPPPPGIADSHTPRGPGAALLRERMWGQKAWQWDATVASIPCTVGPGPPMPRTDPSGWKVLRLRVTPKGEALGAGV